MQSLSFSLPGPAHVADFGGQGQPIVLVHGIGGNHTNWWSLAPLLVEHGRVLAIDLVACGLTKPVGRRCRLSTNGPLVERLLEQLGEPAILIGHSMGGLLSLLLTARSPSLVHRLVLIDPSQPRESPPPNPRFIGQLLLPSVPVIGQRLLDRSVGTRSAAERVEEAWAVSMVDQRRVSEDARRAAIDMAEYWFAQPWHRGAVLAAITSTGRALVDPRRYAQAVRTVTRPTMVVHGEQDHMIRPERIQQLGRQRPDWRLHFVADVGHNPHLEAPDEVGNAIAQFLDDPPDRASDLESQL